MKVSKIVLAAAVVVGISGIANAQNTASVETKVQVYVAEGLDVSVTEQLSFSDIVVPAAGEANTGMSMDCATGDITYKTDASTPNGAADAAGAANALGNKLDSNPGRIRIEGEKDYSVTVSASVTGSGVAGVNFTPRLGTDSTDQPINRKLASDTGINFIPFCGDVEVEAGTETGKVLEVPVSITVSYR
jgi:hypothetical protein